uniref:Uncharacterized protein n=1 Tax=Arundo donax TaxID=35708 RepID=A0A0A9AK75_ARUDO
MIFLWWTCWRLDIESKVLLFPLLYLPAESFTLPCCHFSFLGVLLFS